jgi:hypothetical protein
MWVGPPKTSYDVTCRLPMGSNEARREAWALRLPRGHWKPWQFLALLGCAKWPWVAWGGGPVLSGHQVLGGRRAGRCPLPWSSQVHRLHVAPREEALAATGPAPPPVGVRPLQDLDDVTAAEAELRRVLCREVELGLDEAGPGRLRRKKVVSPEPLSPAWVPPRMSHRRSQGASGRGRVSWGTALGLTKSRLVTGAQCLPCRGHI